MSAVLDASATALDAPFRASIRLNASRLYRVFWGRGATLGRVLPLMDACHSRAMGQVFVPVTFGNTLIFLSELVIWASRPGVSGIAFISNSDLSL